MQKQLEISGQSGESYTFDVYPKSAHLPEKAGLYIITYTHPRGHLAGYQINIICMGRSTNLEAAVADLRERENLAEECWNYTCILCIDDVPKISRILEDLHLKENRAVYC